MPEQSIQRRRVLVIDDEPKLTELLSFELDVEGYDVDIASDGAAGLIRSRSEPTPDLIILDWNLPDFNGIDICQRIRAGGICTPILMLTGHDETRVSVIRVVAAGDHHRSSSPSRLLFRRAVRPDEEIGVNRILQ